VANDYSGISVSTYLNTVSPPMQHFTVPGKYLVELDVNTAGVSGSNPCQLQLFDTINIVDTVVQISLNDTTVCAYNPVTFSFNGKGGQPPYTYRLFVAPDTSMFPLNGPFYGSTSYTFNPAKTSKYIVQVRDLYGCRGYDSNVIVTAQKPVIGNISGPKNLSSISSPVIYSISPQVNNTIFWKVIGGTFLSGQTTDSISVQWLANGTGNISVKVTDTQNCSDSASVNVSVNVGLNELNSFSNLSVYPNPTSGLLNIELETSEKNIDIEVFDIIGKSLLKTTAKHNGGLFQKTIDISHLHEGIYFVKISAGEKSTTVKVTLK
jgi:Secretion system C-terminal sorting domain/PKD-like domain